MKLVSLNTYGGHFFEPLMEFVKLHAVDTDIFCFQEIFDTATDIVWESKTRANLLAEMRRALPEFEGIYAPVQDGYVEGKPGNKKISFGVATFVRRTHKIESSGSIFIHLAHNSYVTGDNLTLPANMLQTQLSVNGHHMMVCNVHGTAFPGHKLDTPERLGQSQIILDFAMDQEGEKIITGDFNLLPETESVRVFEESGFQDLVADFGITTTRGTLIKQLHPEYSTSEYGFQEFADYTFATPGVHVSTYEVPDLSISDHLPLIVTFNITQ